MIMTPNDFCANTLEDAEKLLNAGVLKDRLYEMIDSVKQE